jgi:hypothetical protein
VPSELTQFKPGNPGGPGRPPKSRAWLEILEEILDSNKLLGEENPTGKTNRELLLERAVYLAAKGDFRYFKEIIDRCIGPVPKAEPRSDVTMEDIAAMEEIKPRGNDGEVPPVEGDAPGVPG